MKPFFLWTLVSASLVASLAACSSEDPPPTQITPGGQLVVTADSATVKANGVASTSISVAGSKTGPITLVTDRGSFEPVEEGKALVKTTTLQADGAVTLYGCDGGDNPACVGRSTVRATDAAKATGLVDVQFALVEVCDNGVDDNGNGTIDCEDTEDCPKGAACNVGDAPAGLVCDAKKACAACVPEGGAKAESGKELSCEDGGDNDCDGKIDCEDEDCEEAKCTTSAGGDGACAAGECACPGTAEVCDNGVDDDCDGKTDCADDACETLACKTPGDADGTCGGGACVCTPSLEGCGDGVDNDCDGKADCEDDECADTLCDKAKGLVCGADEKCSKCPSGQAAEVTCGDSADEDCDGKTDCEDEDCLGLSCGTTSTQVCEATECVDSASAYALTLTLERAAIPADGLATSLVTATLKNTQGGVISNKAIKFEIVSGPGDWLANAQPTITTSTSAEGVASAAFRSSADGGVATVKITLDGTSVGATATINMPQVASIKAANTQYKLMGVKSSGYQEQNQITFQVLDSANAPYPAGLLVTFTHETLGGTTIGSAPLLPVPTCTQPDCKVTTTGVTDASGKATVTLYSGNVQGPVAVSIDATGGGQPANASSPVIAIVGAKASGSHIVLSCPVGNVPALLSNTCVKSQVSSSFQCRVSLADRFNNVLGVATTATFKSEGGTAGQPSTTPQYDPASPSTGLGEATNVISTIGDLPIDVDPDPVEEPYSLSYNYNGCGPKVHNPRDGVVTVMVRTLGEEGYFDTNGDGTYNGPGGEPGITEPFIDLGEPFLDKNDNNVRDDGEDLTDLNNNGVWDGPNGVWDSNTELWAEAKVVFTDAPLVVKDPFGNNLYSRFFVASPPEPATDATFSIPTGTTQLFNVFMTDVNFNPIARSATWTTTKVFGGVSTTFVDQPTSAEPSGFLLKDEYCDGKDPSVCGPECPPAKGVTQCVRKSKLNSFEYGSFGRIAVTGQLPLGAAEVRVTGVVAAGTSTKTSHVSLSGTVTP